MMPACPLPVPIFLTQRSLWLVQITFISPTRPTLASTPRSLRTHFRRCDPRGEKTGAVVPPKAALCSGRLHLAHVSHAALRHADQAELRRDHHRIDARAAEDVLRRERPDDAPVQCARQLPLRLLPEPHPAAAQTACARRPPARRPTAPRRAASIASTRAGITRWSRHWTCELCGRYECCPKARIPRLFSTHADH